MELEAKRTELLSQAKTLLEKEGATAEDISSANDLMAQAETVEKQIAARAALANIEVRAAGSNRKTLPSNPAAASFDKKDIRSYSLLRAISLRAAGKELDGLEKEVNDEIARRSGKRPEGFYVPMQAMDTRALDLSAGTGSVGVNLVPEMIELLRDKLVVNQLGATVMSNMSGKFSLPRQSGGATAYWVGEAGAPTTSAQSIDQVPFVPKTVGAYTDISRQFVNQTSIDAEAFVRNDLARVLANAIDKAAISGLGSSNEPKGILNTAGIGSVAGGTNGLAPTWANIVALETAVLAANASADKLAYLTNSKVIGKLKVTDKTSGGYGQFLLGSDGKLNGYDVAVTNAVTSTGTKGTASGVTSTMLFGNWSDLVLALFSGLDVTVDPYSGSTSGTLRIVALQDIDIQLRHAASFAAITDLLTA